MGDNNKQPLQAPPTPPDVDKKHYFYASGHFYYFDDHRRVYLEDGTSVYDGSSSFQMDGTHVANFYIREVPYRFDSDDLFSGDSGGTYNRVHIWQSESETIGRHMSMQEMFHHLLHHGCVDLSSQMDAQQDIMIVNGGGFGDIWLGKLKNGTQVAVKTWRACLIEQCDYKVLKRATREIHFWSRLRHENIHQLMGIIMFKGQCLGMVSQWMENGNLNGYMRKNPHVDRYQLSIQVASGLVYMHQHDAVHGDLRASNILVSPDGVARLSDFGLSTMSEAGLAFSETTNTQAGSMRWASPEHLLEGSPNSKPSDIYSLGMLASVSSMGVNQHVAESQTEIPPWALSWNSPQKGPQENAVVWLQTSVIESPVVISAINPSPSFGVLPSFGASQPDPVQGISLTFAERDNITESRKAAENAQSRKKRSKDNQLRLPPLQQGAPETRCPTSKRSSR
ncbi:unnamed protein product [Rhizoctonia solani]|uniref:Protein kinase domain-containing protein n=1 Tax=Rhizoctonia solani TaxID=456999 RepID=A0A8H3B845_9AGAM|nr:unnamed protein product [Rhizoctonia solani]